MLFVEDFEYAVNDCIHNSYIISVVVANMLISDKCSPIEIHKQYYLYQKAQLTDRESACGYI